MNWWPFGHKKQPDVATSLEVLRHQMIAKDPTLYRQIGSLLIEDGRAKWREKYPDDLASDSIAESRVN